MPELPNHRPVPAEGEQKGPSKNELKKLAKQAEKEKKAAEKAAKQAELKAAQAAAEVVSDFTYSQLRQLKTRYPGLCCSELRKPSPAPVSRAYWWVLSGPSSDLLTDICQGRERIQISTLTEADVGKTVFFRARIQTLRAQGRSFGHCI